MLRQVSTRCQRGKGGSTYKLKNGLQITLIIAICLWLLNQMEQPHDRRWSGRKDLGGAAAQVEGREEKEAENVGQGIVHERVAEDNGAGNHEMGGEEVAPDREKKRRSKRVGSLDDGDVDHEEASHEAREISFRGDDASSEVVAVHAVQEANQEQGLQEAGERSFPFAVGHDASRAAAHAAQVNESDLGTGGGAANQGDKESVKKERRDGAAELPHNLEGNGLRTHNTKTTTAGKGQTEKNNKERQPEFTRTANAAIDITQIDKLQINSTNFAVPQNQTAATDSMDGLTHRVLKLETFGDKKHRLESKCEHCSSLAMMHTMISTICRHASRTACINNQEATESQGSKEVSAL